MKGGNMGYTGKVKRIEDTRTLMFDTAPPIQRF